MMMTIPNPSNLAQFNDVQPIPSMSIEKNPMQKVIERAIPPTNQVPFHPVHVRSSFSFEFSLHAVAKIRVERRERCHDAAAAAAGVPAVFSRSRPPP